MKGYQIIEPAALQALFSDEIYHIFCVALMTWLCELLRAEFEDHLTYVDFEVIRVTYMGSYPAIGIRYKDQNHKDIWPTVEAAIDRALMGKSALELLKFVSKNQTDWKEVTAKLMSDRKG